MAKLMALPERGLLRVKGPEAKGFLQNLITNNMDLLADQEAIFSGLLSPQGKINFEFFIISDGDDFILDVLRHDLDVFIKKLSLYKLRADVAFENMSETHKVFAIEDHIETLNGQGIMHYNDPRLAKMGLRLIVPVEQCEALRELIELDESAEYLRLRLQMCVPEGGADYVLGDTFPHEAAYDLLGGIDFNKGCYIGQEVVSRMHHRASVRKRIVKIVGQDELPLGDAEIRTENSLIGTVGSRLGCEGLALVRLDRAATANNNSDILRVDGVPVKLEMPDWADYQINT